MNVKNLIKYNISVTIYGPFVSNASVFCLCVMSELS